MRPSLLTHLVSCGVESRTRRIKDVWKVLRASNAYTILPILLQACVLAVALINGKGARNLITLRFSSESDKCAWLIPLYLILIEEAILFFLIIALFQANLTLLRLICVLVRPVDASR